MTYKRILFGIIIILIGSVLIAAAIQIAYKSDDVPKMLPLAIISFAFGALIAGHGLFYTLTGEWVPYLAP